MTRPAGRVSAIAVAVALAVAGVATVALGSPQFAATFQMTHVPARAGASAGIETLMTWSDPGEPGGKPKRVTRIKLVFNRGTRIDTSAVRRCRASDADVLREGARACPAASKIGTATSKLTTSTGPPAQTAIKFFNARRQIIVMVRASGRTLAVYRDDIKGSTVTVNLDLPASLSLLELHARIEPHARGRGRNRRVYFRNPSTCPPGGQWTTTVVFTYGDASVQQLSDPTPCTSA